MEEFGQSSDVWNRKWKSSSQVRCLELGMEDFEPSLRLGIGNGGVRAKFGRLESEMEEFKPSSDAWNRKWRSSRPVPKLGIGNGRVRAKFEAWNRKCTSSSQIPMLGIGNGSSRLGIGNVGVRTKFVAWNRKWRSSSPIPTVEIWKGGVRA